MKQLRILIWEYCMPQDGVVFLKLPRFWDMIWSGSLMEVFSSHIFYHKTSSVFMIERSDKFSQ